MLRAVSTPGIRFPTIHGRLPGLPSCSPLLAIGFVAGCILIVMGLIGRPHFDDPRRCPGAATTSAPSASTPRHAPSAEHRSTAAARSGSRASVGVPHSSGWDSPSSAWCSWSRWAGSSLPATPLRSGGRPTALRSSTRRDRRSGHLKADPNDGTFCTIGNRLQARTLTAEEAESVVAALAAVVASERGARRAGGEPLSFALTRSGNAIDQMIAQGLLGEESIAVLARMLSDQKIPAIPSRTIDTEPLWIDFWSLSLNQPPINVLRTVVMPKELRIDEKVEVEVPAIAETASRSRPTRQRLAVQGAGAGAGAHEVELDIERLVVRTDGWWSLPPRQRRRLAARQRAARGTPDRAARDGDDPHVARGRGSGRPRRRGDRRSRHGAGRAQGGHRAHQAAACSMPTRAEFEVELALDPLDGVPILGQVTATLDGKEFVGGTFSVVRSGNTTSQSNSPSLQRPDPAGRHRDHGADPHSPAAVRRRRPSLGSRAAWGSTIDLGDVPLERRDGGVQWQDGRCSA